MTTQKLALVPLLLAPALCLGAQGLQFEAELGLGNGTPALKKVTQSALGYRAGLGISTPLTEVNRGRLILAYLKFPGTEVKGLRSNLSDVQLLGEITYPTRFKGLEGTLGLSLNKWSVDNTGTEVMGPAVLVSGQYRPYPVSVFAMKNTQGLKFGLRAGLTFSLDRHWQLYGAFQMAEAAGGVVEAPVKKPDGTYTTGYTNHGSVNPSWLEVGLRWSF